MDFVEAKIIEILEMLPSEGPNVDYKGIPYSKYKKRDFVRDILAMLNCEPYMYDDKFIIFGVDDSRQLIGLVDNDWKDDNEIQNTIKAQITPEPRDIRTGTVNYKEKTFGYIYISPLNDEWIYEASNDYYPEGSYDNWKECIFKGQAFIRRGSKNEVLFSNDRKRILNKKIQTNTYKPVTNTSPLENNQICGLALLGKWDDKYDGDKQAIQLFTDSSAENVNKYSKNELINASSPISYSNGIWRIRNKEEVLQNYSEMIFDSQIDDFFELLRDVYDLPLNDSSHRKSVLFENSQYNYVSNQLYSKSLRNSLLETLAILNNNEKRFRNCSTNKIVNGTFQFIRDFFDSNIWKRELSEGDNTQLLAESCPDYVLTRLIEIAKNNDLYEVINDGYDQGYKYKLSNTICSLAILERLFSKSIYLLFVLSQKDEFFLEPIERIILPWYPQTHAKSTSRQGALKFAINEMPDLVWKVLMKLMPGSKTSTIPVEKPRFIVVDDINPVSDQEEYSREIIAYLKIAFSLLESDIDKMCQLVGIIDDVSSDLQSDILEVIKDNSKSLSTLDKEKLWNCLNDFVARHRKFHGAKWALPSDRIDKILDFAHWLLPDEKHARILRIFRGDQYQLFEDISDYRKEEERLRSEQLECLQDIYSQKGIDGILSLSLEVENKKLMGILLSETLSDADIKNVIGKSDDVLNDDFVYGIISSKKDEEVFALIADFSDKTKAGVVSKLPISTNVVCYVSGLDSNSQRIYWLNVQPSGVDLEEKIIKTVVRNFNEVDRADASLFVLFIKIRKHDSISDQSVVIDTLKIYRISDDERVTSLDYYIQELIKWLQGKDVSKEIMLLIEWKFIDYLKEYEGYTPHYLWSELSINPEYFISIVRDMHDKSVNHPEDFEDRSSHIRKCYKLLYGWKIVPGTNSEGEIDAKALCKWMHVATDLGEKYGISNYVWGILGRVFFYSPKDKDGFFIDKNIVRYLQQNKEALLGYQIEAYNSRGAHWVDSTGETEFAIEDDYRKKAEEAEGLGLCIFANALRSIADEYHEVGERNIREG